jgi:proteasome assembly chaperone (PAC2) family protein
MPDTPKLNRPLLVAVWPGMGHVALNAGVYLLAKLGMTAVEELDGGELFDISQVEVSKGVIQPARRPRNRFFVWTNPDGGPDLVLFLGETQPPVGKYPFCKQVMDYAVSLGVERVVTFAAMATGMRPEHDSRVFGAATDEEGVGDLRKLKLKILQGGNIGGLNGVLLGAAAARGLRGWCFLGEMPQMFAQVPFPKASHAILEVFRKHTGVAVDLDELSEQSKEVEEQLGELLARVEEQYGPQPGGPDPEGDDPEFGSDDDPGAPDEPPISGAPEGVGYHYDAPDAPVTGPAVERIEELFARAAGDRTKAFELKRELDERGLFKQYEDRFLDLFKQKD